MTTGVAAAYRTLSIHDLDGSTTGIPDSYVLLHDGENDSVATDDTCEIQPTWNASVCTGDVGRLQLSASGGPDPQGVLVLTLNRSVRFAVSCACAGGCSSRRGCWPGRARWWCRRRWCCSAAANRLSRNGKDFKITGNQSTVRAGTEIRVKTERPEVALSLS